MKPQRDTQIISPILYFSRCEMTYIIQWQITRQSTEVRAPLEGPGGFVGISGTGVRCESDLLALFLTRPVVVALSLPVDAAK